MGPDDGAPAIREEAVELVPYELRVLVLERGLPVIGFGVGLSPEYGGRRCHSYSKLR